MWSVCVLLVAVSHAVAHPNQDQPQEPRKPGWLLNQVFPNPTGDNGIEDLLIAAEMLDGNRAFREYEELWIDGQATLQHKRSTVTSCKAVLARIRTGLARESFRFRESVTFDTPLPGYGHLRRLAKLLSAEQEVHFADGREMQAIDSFRDGYRLGQLLDQQMLISGLVGVVCSGLSLAPLARRLDQLDYRECQYLRKVCEQLLEHPSGVPSMLMGELRCSLEFLQRSGERDWVSYLIEFGYGDLEEGWTEDSAALRAAVEEHPELLEQAARQAQEIVRRYYSELLAELQKPAWERTYPDPLKEDDGSWPWLLARALMPPWSTIADRFTADRARLQLLAVHAAVLEYRWWYGVTPADLSKLNLGETATDPFTGKPLIYKRLGDYRFKLYSAGPNKEDDDGDRDSDVVLVRDM
ncbi:MAG: hypothetical protein AMXMBFR61_11490 [Fimbriimonadales bacterium]